MFPDQPNESAEKQSDAPKPEGQETVEQRKIGLEGEREESNRDDANRDDVNRTVSRRQITRLIGSSDLPCYVLDDQDVVVYVNDSMTDFCGLNSESILGLDCSRNDLIAGELSERSAFDSFLEKQDVGEGILKRLKGMLAPPAIWDRKAIYLEPVGSSVTRLLLPLDSKSADNRSGSSRATVLGLLLPNSTSAIADQLSLVTSTLKRGHESNQTTGVFSNEGEANWANSLATYASHWIAAGTSLRAEALRQQLIIAQRVNVSTFIHGPACEEREALAEWIHAGRVYLAGGEGGISSLKREGAEGASLNSSTAGEVFAKSFGSASDSTTVSMRLVRIDCHLLDEMLLDDLFEVVESMLASKRGSVSIFLSRVDELPSNLVLLLDRFLASHPELRCISTSTKDWEELEDLSSLWGRLRYRLEHLSVTLPPLRSRLEDMENLFASWLLQDVRRGMKHLGQVKHYGAPNMPIAKDAREALYAYSWPGSYAEFSEVLHRARVNAIQREIQLQDLPVSLRTSPSYWENSKSVEPIDLDRLLEDVEKKLITEALEVTKGNRSAASKLLNISRARIIRRMQQWGMMPEGVERNLETSEPELDLPKFEEID